MAVEIKARMVSPPQGRTDGYGIDHDIYIDVDGIDGILHFSCPIPLEQFENLVSAGGSAAIAQMYKELIIEYYGASVPSPEIPQPPIGLSDLVALAEYAAAKTAYETQLAANVESCATLAGQATNWIEGLATFNSWSPGFDFVLQAAE